jgi:hypothetical protein
MNKNVVVRTECINIQGKLIDYEMGAVLIVQREDSEKCIVKDWYAISIKDVVQRLRALYQPPDHLTSHSDIRRNTAGKDVDIARQKFFKHHPHYTRRRKPH